MIKWVSNVVLTAIIILFTTTLARATSYYWDTNGVTAGAGGPSPSGTWNGTNPFWNPTADGTGTPIAAPSIADDLTFCAGSDATGSYTVTLADSPQARSLVFKDGSATLSGVALTLSSSASISNAVDATISAVVTGAVTSLSKSGAGMLILSGTNTYAGATTVIAVTLSVGMMANGGVASGIGAGAVAASNLVINGGALQFTGGNATINRMFTVSAAGGVIDVTNSASTLTISGAGFVLNGTLTKVGAGSLAFSGERTSTAGAARDFVVAGGTLTFSTSYDWTSSLPFSGNVDMLVTNGATLRTAPSAFGGVPWTTEGGLHSVTVTENSKWILAGGSRSFIQGTTCVILQGGAVATEGSWLHPFYGLTVQTLASPLTATNAAAISPYSSGGSGFNVADGAADPDFVQAGNLGGGVTSWSKNGG